MMKPMTILTLAVTMALAGCASSNDGARMGGGPAEETYVPLGSLIAKKTSTRKDNQSVDMQSLENARTMGNGVNNSGLAR